jgi:hypothetical protein
MKVAIFGNYRNGPHRMCLYSTAMSVLRTSLPGTAVEGVLVLEWPSWSPTELALFLKDVDMLWLDATIADIYDVPVHEMYIRSWLDAIYTAMQGKCISPSRKALDWFESKCYYDALPKELRVPQTFLLHSMKDIDKVEELLHHHSPLHLKVGYDSCKKNHTQVKTLDELHTALEQYFNTQGRTTVIVQPEYKPFKESKNVVSVMDGELVCPKPLHALATALNVPLPYYRLDLVRIAGVSYVNEITVVDMGLWDRDAWGIQAGTAMGSHLVQQWRSKSTVEEAVQPITIASDWPLPHPGQNILQRRLRHTLQL